ncbi:bile acid:sodium symporter family protein [Aquincola tertiaricarbonis]|uniref:bile acid:sodium symporter family protein n=1 Tax=Aquincola tertiaricarbonis TaxID=391953 RepID=UPI000614C431|nr:bile acid:sodium symporter family protein [Aquincola tertiaricarbonis]
MRRPAFLPDNFVLLLLAVLGVATVLPVHGVGAQGVKWLTNACVAGLFFLHGAKLSREAVVAGLLHWRLHLTVISATFILFPILGLALRPLFEPLIGPTLYLGVLFVCALPSTVQSSIAFTSIGKGNVPAAMCSASTSNIAGIALTPLLIAAMASTSSASSGAAGVMSWQSAAGIVGLLLLPFVAGQIAQRWIGAWVARHRGMLKWFDQGSILLVVYSAFSEATVQGLYQQVSLGTLGILVGISALLLFVVMGLLVLFSRRMGFSREDEVAIVFCGSKKTLASGVPMAQILFAGQAVGLIVLPIMVFHQLQLMVCASIAQRYARRAAQEQAAPAVAVAPAARR